MNKKTIRNAPSCGEAELIHTVATIDMPIRRVTITEYNEATLHKFTDEEKAYDVHYTLQQKR